MSPLLRRGDRTHEWYRMFGITWSSDPIQCFDFDDADFRDGRAEDWLAAIRAANTGEYTFIGQRRPLRDRDAAGVAVSMRLPGAAPADRLADVAAETFCALPTERRAELMRTISHPARKEYRYALRRAEGPKVLTQPYARIEGSGAGDVAYRFECIAGDVIVVEWAGGKHFYRAEIEGDATVSTSAYIPHGRPYFSGSLVYLGRFGGDGIPDWAIHADTATDQRSGAPGLVWVAAR